MNTEKAMTEKESTITSQKNAAHFRSGDFCVKHVRNGARIENAKAVRTAARRRVIAVPTEPTMVEGSPQFCSEVSRLGC